MKQYLCLICVSAVLGSTDFADITVDDCGETLTFDTTPERIVVHDMNMTDIAFALELQDKMVGLTGITGWYKPVLSVIICAAKYLNWHRSIQPSKTWFQRVRTCSLLVDTMACAPAAMSHPTHR